MADPPSAATRAAGGIAAAAGLIAVVTLVSRAVGFGRTLVFSEAVRADGIGSIYNSVNALPNVLYEVAAGGVLAAVTVPVIAGHLGRGDAERAHASASALLTWSLTLLVPLAALLAVAAPWLASALVDTRQPGAAAAGTTMLRIFATQVPLYGVGIVLAGLLQAHRRFLAAALAPLLSSVVVIGAYLVYGSLVEGATAPAAVSHGAVLLLAWGTTAGVVALSIPLLFPVARAGWRWRPTWRFPAGDARRSAGLAGAGVIALLAQQAAVVATIWVANHRGDGGTQSVYQYVQAVYLLPYAVLAVPIATSAFPALAQGHAAGTQLGPVIARASRAVLLLTAAAAAVLMAVSPQVGRFFAALDARRGGGRVSAGSLSDLGSALEAYAPGVVGFGLAALLTRAVYVRGRPYLAAAGMAAGWLVAAVVPLAVLRPGAGPAAALRTLGWSSTAGMWLAAVLLLVLVRRSWGAGATSGLARAAAAAGLGGAAAFLVGSVAGRVLAWTGIWGFMASAALSGGLAMGAFVVFGRLVDTAGFDEATARLRRRRRGPS
ncbi:MAG: lipid II flippase MurJ [Nostocoides sp.]